MTDLRAELIQMGLTGPYHLEWPEQQGGFFRVMGAGWKIPLVAMGARQPMESLVVYLNSGVTAKSRAFTHDADCPARDCTCGAEGYREWASKPAPPPEAGLREALAKEIARALTLLGIEGNQPNASYARYIADYLIGYADPEEAPHE